MIVITIIISDIIIGFIIYMVLRVSIKRNYKIPIEILKTRYANGEITKEEFENIKKDLEIQ